MARSCVPGHQSLIDQAAREGGKPLGIATLDHDDGMLRIASEQSDGVDGSGSLVHPLPIPVSEPLRRVAFGDLEPTRITQITERVVVWACDGRRPSPPRPSWPSWRP
jgi:hypothetical protein